MWCVDRSYLVSVDFTVFDSIGNISCEDLLENCNDNQRNQQIQLMKYIYLWLLYLQSTGNAVALSHSHPFLAKTNALYISCIFLTIGEISYINL